MRSYRAATLSKTGMSCKSLRYKEEILLFRSLILLSSPCISCRKPIDKITRNGYNVKAVYEIARLCKGSTTDSDSVCLGSNPSRATKKEPHNHAVVRFFSFYVVFDFCLKYRSCPTASSDNTPFGRRSFSCHQEQRAGRGAYPAQRSKTQLGWNAGRWIYFKRNENKNLNVTPLFQGGGSPKTLLSSHYSDKERIFKLHFQELLPKFREFKHIML